MTMKKLNELSWFEQCIVKLDVAQDSIHQLESQKVFDVHDQVKVNMILGLLKSPIDYSINAIQSKYGREKKKAYVPYLKENQSYESFKVKLLNELGTDSDEALQLILSVQEIEGIQWYSQLNEMNNTEKHNSITLHKKRIIENSGHLILPGNNIISNNIFEYSEDSNSRQIVIDGESIDFTSAEGYSREEFLTFDFNGEPVFDFLNLSLNKVNDFIIDTYILLEGQEPSLSIMENLY